jgi:hypothetical protein
MSLVVIPSFTHRPPAITTRWWIQLFGHIPFVATPILWAIGRFPRAGGVPHEPDPARKHHRERQARRE